jgi:predicted RNase H-like nuclease (RuvC/YqgF family)
MESALTEEKDSLANELRGMVMAYDTLKTNNDTLNAGLEKERDRIVRLLSVNASNVQLIKKYKSEINTMREIMKSYIVQIDSLNTRNKFLSSENVQIKSQMTEIQNTNQELSQLKEDLTSKVAVGAVVKAKDITAVALNKNRKETKRINYLDKLRVCFTLRENPLAQAGTKQVYLRVLRPDSLVITTSADNTFSFGNSQLVYSAMREVEYANQDIEMCIFVDNTGDFIVGNYSIELYLENNLIGSTTFNLAKK